GQRELRLLVCPGRRAEAAPRSGAAAEDAPQQLVDVDIAGREAEVPVAEVRGEGALALPLAPSRSGPLPRCLPPVGTGPRSLPGLRIHPLGNLPEVAAERVVAPPQLPVRQHVVGLRDLLEALLGGRVLVDVGVVRPRQLAVRALDLLLVGGPRDAQDLVEVSGLCHGPSPTTLPAPRRSSLRWRPRLLRGGAGGCPLRRPAAPPPPPSR